MAEIFVAVMLLPLVAVFYDLLFARRAQTSEPMAGAVAERSHA